MQGVNSNSVNQIILKPQGNQAVNHSHLYIFERCKLIFDKLKNLDENSNEFHSKRSELYSYFHRMQQPYPPVAFKNDISLSKAEKIIKSLLFANHPGSLNRLMPSAKGYVDAFHSLGKLIDTELLIDSMGFVNEVESFALSHDSFTDAYCLEMREVGKNQADWIQVTYSSDIDFIVKSCLSSLGKPPLQALNGVIEKILDRDDKYVHKFSSLALERALRKQNPLSLFEPFRRDFESLAEDYQLLTYKEQQSITSRIYGKQVAELTHNAKNVLTTIEAYSYQWPRADHFAKQYASILSIIYPKVSQSFCLLRQLKLLDLPKENSFSNHKMFQIIFYAGLFLKEETDESFEFFKQEEVSNFQNEFKKFSEIDRKKIECALISEKPIKLKSKILEEFMVDLRYFGVKLKESKHSALLAQIFRSAM